MTQTVNPIRKLRDARGLSQAAVAARANVTVTTVGLWERWAAVPSLRKYPDLASALGVSIAEIQDAVREIETVILQRRDAG